MRATPLTRLGAPHLATLSPLSQGEGKRACGTRAGITLRKKLIPARKNHPYPSRTLLAEGRHSRGVLMAEQAGGGRGDAALNSGSRRPAIPGLGLVRRPRPWFAAMDSGGVGAPPGDTTIPCREPADRRKCRKARPDAVVRTPPQSVERRAGLRYWPVVSGDPKIDLAARRVTRCGASAPAPVGALLPSFLRGRKTDERAPVPRFPGRRSVGYPKNPRPVATYPGTWRRYHHSRRGSCFNSGGLPAARRKRNLIAQVEPENGRLACAFQ